MLQNFVVRQSSQSDTMALSVRLPAGKGPYIEHYLIQANKGKLSLETSENRFDNIPSLIAHYSQCWWVPFSLFLFITDFRPGNDTRDIVFHSYLLISTNSHVSQTIALIINAVLSWFFTLYRFFFLNISIITLYTLWIIL